jgi:signal peptidase II
MKLKKMKKASIAIILLVFALDLISKMYILGMTGLSPVPFWGAHAELFPRFVKFMEVSPYLNIVLVWNTGISFSLLSDSSDFNRWALIVVSLLIMRLIYKMMRESDERLDVVGFAMIIGGALGNVADRVRYGAVIDFIDFHIGKHHWPVFNFADAFICLGVALLIFRLLFMSYGYRKPFK